MKKTILLMVMMMIGYLSFSQDEQYIKPGIYKGEIEENGSVYNYTLKVSTDGYVSQCDNTTNTEKTFPYKKTSSEALVTTMQWINYTPSWTETQTFYLTKLSNSVILVCHMRYVVNESDKRSSWGYTGKGIFYLED